MTSIYQRQIDSAKRLISSKGQLVLWRKLIPAPVTNKWKPEPATSEDYNVRIVFLPQTNAMKQFLRYMKDSDVPTGSIVGYMASVTFQPSLNDVVVRGSDIYKIKSLDPIAPNGDTILWIIEFDK